MGIPHSKRGRLIKRIMAVTLGVSGLVVVGTSVVGSAHHPVIEVTCNGVKLTGDDYQKNDKQNTYSLTLDDITRSGNFNQSFSTSINNPNKKIAHTYTYAVTEPTNNPKWTVSGSGTIAACAPQHIPVTLCHQKGNGDYVVITIDDDGENFHGHGSHEGDIIPAPAEGCPASQSTTSSSVPVDDSTTTTVSDNSTTTTVAVDDTTTTTVLDSTTTTSIVADDTSAPTSSVAAVVPVEDNPTPAAPVAQPSRPAVSSTRVACTTPVVNGSCGLPATGANTVAIISIAATLLAAGTLLTVWWMRVNRRRRFALASKS